MCGFCNELLIIRMLNGFRIFPAFTHVPKAGPNAHEDVLQCALHATLVLVWLGNLGELCRCLLTTLFNLKMDRHNDDINILSMITDICLFCIVIRIYHTHVLIRPVGRPKTSLFLQNPAFVSCSRSTTISEGRTGVRFTMAKLIDPHV